MPTKLRSGAWQLVHSFTVCLIAVGLAISAPVWLWLAAVSVTVGLQCLCRGCPITKLRERFEGRTLNQAKISQLYERCRWQAAILSGGSLLLTGCSAKQLAVSLPYWPSFWRSAIIFLIAWVVIAGFGTFCVCSVEGTPSLCCLLGFLVAAWYSHWQYSHSLQPNCSNSQVLHFCVNRHGDERGRSSSEPDRQSELPPADSQPVYGR